MPDTPHCAWRQAGVFSRDQARSAGWTDDALRWAVRRGRLIRLRAGAFQVADLGHLTAYERDRWLHAGPGVGAVLTTPGAQASHGTAAVLRGLPLLTIPAAPCVTVVPWHTGEIGGTHVHRTTSGPLTLPVGAVECTSVARTALDLAREHGVAAGVVALDFALAEGMSDRADVASTLSRLARWPGVRAAREAAAKADPRSESVLESVSRVRLTQFGFPAPDLQVTIANAAARRIGRVDFLWADLGVVGEADGALKYDGSNPDALVDEKRRQELLEETGLIVVRWGWREVLQFDLVAQRLRRAFEKARRRPAEERRWAVLPDPARRL